MKNTEYEIVLEQGVLNDDTLYKVKDGYHFGNNRNNKFCVVYYTFANEWSNHKHSFFSTTLKNAIERYIKIAKPCKERRKELRDLQYAEL